MATTPEGKVKQKVKKVLDKYGAYQFWPVQTGYGAAGVDCYACINGYFLAIETKAGRGKPTPRQELVLKQVTEAGGKSLVVGGKYLSVEGFETWLVMSGIVENETGP